MDSYNLSMMARDFKAFTRLHSVEAMPSIQLSGGYLGGAE